MDHMLFTCREGVGALSRQQSSFSPDRGHFIIPIMLRWLVIEEADCFTSGEGHSQIQHMWVLIARQ